MVDYNVGETEAGLLGKVEAPVGALLPCPAGAKGKTLNRPGPTADAPGHNDCA